MPSGSARCWRALVFPLYFLTRRVFDRNTACAAATYSSHCPCVEVTSDGISDGCSADSGLGHGFAVCALDQERPRRAFVFGLAAGLCCGLGYLVRPEGCMIAGAIGLTLAGLAICRWRRGGMARPPFVAGFGLVLGMAVLAMPYVALIGWKLTNKPTGNQLIDQMQGKEAKPTYFERSQLGAGKAPLATWWNADEAGDQSRAMWACKAVLDEYWKTAHYSLVIFAVIGLFTLRKRLGDPRVVFVLFVGALHVMVLWWLAWRIGYVSQRHTLLTVMISCILAACAFALRHLGGPGMAHANAGESGACSLPCLASPAPRTIHMLRSASPWFLGTIWTLLLPIPAVPRDFYSLHADRAGHKAAGQWLAEHGDPNIELIDPFGWGEWYAGRSMREIPPAPNPWDGKPKYVIFEPNAKSPHSRLEYCVRQDPV